MNSSSQHDRPDPRTPTGRNNHPTDLLEAHLLNLPRELRDKIYAHLHHKVQKRCPRLWDGNLNPPMVTHVTRLTYHNAPLPSVLLTHPRLYHEYKEAACFTDATVSVDVVPEWNGKFKQKDFYVLENILKGRLTGLKRLTIYLNTRKISSNGFLNDCGIEKILLMLVPNSPDLGILRLALRNLVADGIQYQDLIPYIRDCCFNGQETRILKPRRMPFDLQPPAKIMGLPMRQHGEGYVIEYDGRPRGPCMFYHGINGMPEQLQNTYVEYSSSSRLGFFVYSAQELKDVDAFKVDDFWVKWPMRKVGVNLLNCFRATRHKEIVVEHMNKMKEKELENWYRENGRWDIVKS